MANKTSIAKQITAVAAVILTISLSNLGITQELPPDVADMVSELVSELDELSSEKEITESVREFISNAPNERLKIAALKAVARTSNSKLAKQVARQMQVEVESGLGSSAVTGDSITATRIARVTDEFPKTYRDSFDRYVQLIAPNGKPINIFAQKEISDPQLRHVRDVMLHFLTDYPDSEFGSSKGAIANRMADNQAMMMICKGRDGQFPSPRFNAQPLYSDETIVEGTSAYINNEYERHRDATLEEVLHCVHDFGIGVDVKRAPEGAAPELQKEIRAATTAAMGNGIWPSKFSEERTSDWIEELRQEGSLTQEYIASVIDSYYGLWGPFDKDFGMWGIYIAKTREDVEQKDPKGYSIVQKFFHPYLTYNAEIDTSFQGTFTMTFDKSIPYTHKSRYLLHAHLTGTNNANLTGNEQDNTLAGNAGDNVIDGGEGTDTVVFSKPESCYEVTENEDGSMIVVGEGTDRLINIERVIFDGAELEAKRYAVPVPIKGAAEEGSSVAEGMELEESVNDVDQMFQHIDRNDDGKIQRSEVPSLNQSDFDEADVNGDGIVTREEFGNSFTDTGEKESNEDGIMVEEEAGNFPRNTNISPDSDKKTLWTIAQGEDWPAFLGPNRDGKSNESGILKDWSGDNLKIVWQRKIGSGYSNASISRGRAIIADRVGDELRVLCLNAENGKHLWEYRTDNTYVDDLGYSNGPRATPIIEENRVYIHGTSGHLICLDFYTGNEVWRRDTFKEFDVAKNFFGVASTPIIEDDKLLVMIGGSTKESQKAYDRSSDDYSLLKPNGSCVVAFDKLTGDVVYKSGNHLCSWSSIQTATIDGRRWAFAYARHGLMGFDPTNGKEDFYINWQPKQWKKTSIATPVVIDDTVLISESYGPGSIFLRVSNQGEKNKIIWQDGNRVREKKIQTCISTAIHLDGFVYGCSSNGPSSGDFRCIKLSTGELMWKARILVGLGNATYVDGHFIVTAEHGKLMLIKADSEKFELVTEYEKPDVDHSDRVRFSKPLWAAPVISQGLLYLRDAENLYCFQLKASE